MPDKAHRKVLWTDFISFHIKESSKEDTYIYTDDYVIMYLLPSNKQGLVVEAY